MKIITNEQQLASGDFIDAIIAVRGNSTSTAKLEIYISEYTQRSVDYVERRKYLGNLIISDLKRARLIYCRRQIIRVAYRPYSVSKYDGIITVTINEDGLFTKQMCAQSIPKPTPEPDVVPMTLQEYERLFERLRRHGADFMIPAIIFHHRQWRRVNGLEPLM